jgi:UDP-glucuronate 4-epimerase
MKYKKILLTGAEGFIGKHLRESFDCTIYDLVNGDDIRDKFKLDNLFNKEHFDLVINLAARAGVPMGEEHYEEFFSVNCIGLKNLIEVCKKYNSKLVHFSSSSAIQAKSVYGITKLAGERLVASSGLDYIIIRPFTVIGENGRKEMVIYKWKEQYKRGEKITFYGDGTTFRGYTYVGDLVDGVIKSLEFSEATFNIGGNEKITLEDLWNIFKEVYPNAEREILPLPNYDITGEMADNTLITTLTGWKPKIDIKLKIKELLQYE